jgi:hypothetical protein
VISCSTSRMVMGHLLKVVRSCRVRRRR